MDPLVPVTVILYEPGRDDAVEIVKVEFPVPPEVRVTLVGFKFRTRPAGETESVRLTVPVNPPRLVNTMESIAVKPCDMPMLESVDTIEKLGFETALTVTKIPVTCDKAPLTPVTIMV